MEEIIIKYIDFSKKSQSLLSISDTETFLKDSNVDITEFRIEFKDHIDVEMICNLLSDEAFLADQTRKHRKAILTKFFQFMYNYARNLLVNYKLYSLKAIQVTNVSVADCISLIPNHHHYLKMLGYNFDNNRKEWVYMENDTWDLQFKLASICFLCVIGYCQLKDNVEESLELMDEVSLDKSKTFAKTSETWLCQICQYRNDFSDTNCNACYARQQTTNVFVDQPVSTDYKKLSTDIIPSNNLEIQNSSEKNQWICKYCCTANDLQSCNCTSCYQMKLTNDHLVPVVAEESITIHKNLDGGGIMIKRKDDEGKAQFEERGTSGKHGDNVAEDSYAMKEKISVDQDRDKQIEEIKKTDTKGKVSSVKIGSSGKQRGNTAKDSVVGKENLSIDDNKNKKVKETKKTDKKDKVSSAKIGSSEKQRGNSAKDSVVGKENLSIDDNKNKKVKETKKIDKKDKVSSAKIGSSEKQRENSTKGSVTGKENLSINKNIGNEKMEIKEEGNKDKVLSAEATNSESKFKRDNSNRRSSLVFACFSVRKSKAEKTNSKFKGQSMDSELILTTKPKIESKNSIKSTNTEIQRQNSEIKQEFSKNSSINSRNRFRTSRTDESNSSINSRNRFLTSRTDESNSSINSRSRFRTSTTDESITVAPSDNL